MSLSKPLPSPPSIATPVPGDGHGPESRRPSLWQSPQNEIVATIESAPESMTPELPTRTPMS